jgi:catechol 2,3-dioxygenase-like lactoylglutathione lyase family enzyme
MNDVSTNLATVRYQVKAIEPSIEFYTKHLGFRLDKGPARSPKCRVATWHSS